MSTPREIWIDGPGAVRGRIWSTAEIFDGDVKYVRGDYYDALKAENERLREELRSKGADTWASSAKRQNW